MNEDGKNQYEDAARGYLSAQVSRSQAIKVAGIGTLAALGFPKAVAAAATGRASYTEFPQLPSPALTHNGRYTTEDAGNILNIAQTAEHFAVTFLTAALGNASTIGLTGLALTSVQAILAAEITHVQLLDAVGAKPLTDTFTVPDPKALSDYTTFFKNVEAADTIFVGAYLAAIREFAELGQPALAKIAGQILGIEAEHRVMARNFLAVKGDAASIPPNNKDYETDLFLYVREAAGLLVSLGFVGGSGTVATFPGLDAATKAAGPVIGQMIQTSPNTAAEGSTTTSNITAQH
jgi:Ferritin-like domain